MTAKPKETEIYDIHDRYINITCADCGVKIKVHANSNVVNTVFKHLEECKGKHL